MARTLQLQTAGVLLMLGSFVAAELASLYLSWHPGSALAWALDLGPFRAFELARAEPSPLRHLFRPGSMAAAFALAAATLVAARLRFRLGIAVMAHLGFAFALGLAYAALAAPGRRGSAGLGIVAAVPAADDALVWVLLLGSFAASALGHASFVSEILGGKGVPDGSGRPT